MNYNKYLPLGSVVLLKGGQHRVMIIGFCTQLDEKSKVVYDYTGCFYPEGLISSEQIFAFNHSNINKIFAVGYSDEEEKKFKAKLDVISKKYIDKVLNSNTSKDDLINDKIERNNNE